MPTIDSVPQGHGENTPSDFIDAINDYAALMIVCSMPEDTDWAIAALAAWVSKSMDKLSQHDVDHLVKIGGAICKDAILALPEDESE